MTAPVELSREDVERILALAQNAQNAEPYWPPSIHGEIAMLPTVYAECKPSVITALCLAALRGIEREGVTDAMHIAAISEAKSLGYTSANDCAIDADDLLGILEAALSARAQPRGEREPNWRTEGPHCPTCDCATPAKDSE